MGIDRYSEFVKDEATEKMQLLAARTRRGSNLELVLKSYIIFGFVGAIIGVIYIVFDILRIELNQTQQFALIFSGVSISLSLMSYIVLQIRRQRDAAENEKILTYTYTAELIEAWANFEIVSRDVLNSAEEDFNRFSPRSIISKLHLYGRISDNDVIFLQSALEARNMLVHGKEKLPIPLLKNISADLEKIVARLSKAKDQHPSR